MLQATSDSLAGRGVGIIDRLDWSNLWRTPDLLGFEEGRFARIVRMDLKPGKSQGFTVAIDNEIIPTLRRFTGFVGEVAMVSTDGKEAIGISLWEQKEHAESYDHKGFAGVLKALGEYVKGKAKVHTYEVTNSTVEALPVRKAA